MRTQNWPNGLGVDVQGNGWEAEVWTGFAEVTRVRVFDADGEPWRWAELPGQVEPTEAAQHAAEHGEVFEEWTERQERRAAEPARRGAQVDWAEVFGSAEEFQQFRRQLGPLR